ncbi:TolC family protein [Novacetimonas hansenii]|uniref:TolC family protein n=1 Tax=Novacetimonas hansenii TaxID=436 RepID=UPI000A943A62|nr:TolC family protein [Novacetimonas hansenii]
MPPDFLIPTHSQQRIAAASRAARLILVTLVPGLTGCTVGPTYKAPPPPDAATYGETRSDTATVASANSSYQVAGKPGSDWWHLFRSPRLDALVTEALRNNWSIQAAQANLRKAAEGLHAAQGSLMPQIDATGTEGRQEYGAALFGPWAWTPMSPPINGDLSGSQRDDRHLTHVRPPMSGLSSPIGTYIRV